MRGKKGFTLIEVLIVVIILGILATIAIPQFGNMVKRARLSEAWTGLGAVRTAQAIYKMENTDSEYADDIDDIVPSLIESATHGNFSLTIEEGDADGFIAVATGNGVAAEIIARVNSDGDRAWTLDDGTTWSGDAAVQPE
jgi:type IV pilus assembly protein PilE